MDASPGRRGSLQKRVIRLAVLNIVIISILLAVLEIVFRQFESYIEEQNADSIRRVGFIDTHPELLLHYTPKGRRLIPNARVVIRNNRLSKRDILMNINSLGFRDDELPAVKGKNEIRIIVLGDSITCASYLLAHEVYVERLERYLQASMRDKRIEVVNAGVGDIGMKEELDILEERGLSVDPDVVMVAFYLNDSRPPWGFAGEIKNYGFIRRNSVLAQTVYRELVLRNWMREKGRSRFKWSREAKDLDWRNSREAFLQLAKMAEYDWGAAWKDESWELIDGQLARLKALSAEHGFEVVVVCFPVSFQVYAEYLEDKPQRYMRQRAEALGFYYFDLLPMARERNGEELFYDNCHPLPKSNDAIGGALASFLMEQMF